MLDEVADESRSVFRIGPVAELLGVHPRTLRLYEARGLITPSRKRGQRLYSQSDIRWLRCLRRLIHEEGFGLDEVCELLKLSPCWEVRQCPPETRARCPVSRDRRLRCWQLRDRTSPECAGSCGSCEVFIRDKRLSRHRAALEEI